MALSGDVTLEYEVLAASSAIMLIVIEFYLGIASIDYIGYYFLLVTLCLMVAVDEPLFGKL